ncbi:MAG: P-type conjugative transfer protein VirB9 [Rhodospirillales bacterium 12-54-5]|nr:MAG: P-type conjugative transfer protein VirB9 [Rhodospirillales bacterium 12-54-5]
MTVKNFNNRRNLSRFAALFLALCLITTTQPAHALQESRAIATDSRIRSVRYSPNEVYQFIGHYGYASAIIFADDEKVLTVSMGDSTAWQVNPAGNRMFIKPVDQNALTNMTVLTDKRSYLFELHAQETKDIRDKNMVFEMRFVYPQSDNGTLDVNQLDSLPDLERDSARLNFRYTIRGSTVIEPIRIFDDGEFTYFEFRDKNAEIPAFFKVDSINNEALINFRKRGNYIVVEQVASRFTLRRGPDILCVYNEKMPVIPLPQPERSLSQRIREFSPF